MPSLAQLKARTRADYPFVLDYRTRWADNDMYAHMNNSIYNFLFDSVVNTYLIQHTPRDDADADAAGAAGAADGPGFDPARRWPQYGMVVHSHTDYFASLAFPAVAELALRVVRLGRSSAHYEIALFEQGQPGVRAVGVFVQVFVDAATGRPNAATGMHPALRRGLERIRKPLPGDDEDGGGGSSSGGGGSKL